VRKVSDGASKAAKGSRVLKAVRLQDAEHHCRVNPMAEPEQTNTDREEP
jgi:hypothetical protein